MAYRVIRIEGYDVQIQVLPTIKLLGVTDVLSGRAVIPQDYIINATFHIVLDAD